MLLNSVPSLFAQDWPPSFVYLTSSWPCSSHQTMANQTKPLNFVREQRRTSHRSQSVSCLSYRCLTVTPKQEKGTVARAQRLFSSPKSQKLAHGSKPNRQRDARTSTHTRSLAFAATALVTVLQRQGARQVVVVVPFRARFSPGCSTVTWSAFANTSCRKLKKEYCYMLLLQAWSSRERAAERTASALFAAITTATATGERGRRRGVGCKGCFLAAAAGLDWTTRRPGLVVCGGPTRRR